MAEPSPPTAGPKTRTLYHLALIAAIAGSYVTGQEQNFRFSDPTNIARVEALAVRVEALERRAEDPTPGRDTAALAAHVAALRAQLDILLMRGAADTSRGRR